MSNVCVYDVTIKAENSKQVESNLIKVFAINVESNIRYCLIRFVCCVGQLGSVLEIYLKMSLSANTNNSNQTKSDQIKDAHV